jgi:type I restriction enzyme, S subunit
VDTITNAGLASSGARLVPENSLLVTTRATLGLVALTTGPMTTNQGFRSIVFTGRAHPDFYYHLLATLKGEMVRRASGTTFLEISGSQFAQIGVPLPPLREQRQISEILDALDDQIALVTASIEKLLLVRLGMVRDLIEHIDPSRQPKRRVADLVVAGQFGSAIGPFGSNLMASDYRNSGVPVIFVRDIQSGRFDWKSSVYVSRGKALELNAHRADPGDVLITKMGDPPGVATVHPEWFPSAVITADIIRIRPQERLAVPEWLALYINSSHVARQIRALAAGVTRQKLTLADFRGVTISLPTIQEQRSRARRVAAIDRLLDREREERRKLQGVKEGLRADLLAGRVRVPEWGRDEPRP